MRSGPSLARDVPDFLSGPPVSSAPRPIARAVPRKDGRQIPGEAGLWVFLLGDLALFGAFFVAFAVTVSPDPELWSASAAALHEWPGMVNTIVLLVCSFFVARAVAAHGEHRAGDARRHLIASAAFGGLFVVVKTGEYTSLAAAGIGPDTNIFFMYYFVLTGIHLLHVLIGIAVLVACAARLDAATPRFVEGSAAYWHMVDVLWVVIFPLFYLVGRV